MTDPTLTIAIIIMLLLSLMWTVSSVSGPEPADLGGRPADRPADLLSDETSTSP